MPRQKTREELEDRIDELKAENEALQDQVDAIQDILEPEEEDEGEA
jgi:cell division protein FtsB